MGQSGKTAWSASSGFSNTGLFCAKCLEQPTCSQQRMRQQHSGTKREKNRNPSDSDSRVPPNQWPKQRVNNAISSRGELQARVSFQDSAGIPAAVRARRSSVRLREKFLLKKIRRRGKRWQRD